MTTMWMVRAGRGSENVERFLAEGIVAIGDALVGELSSGMTKAEMLKLWERSLPDLPAPTRATWASQCLRFLQEIQAGDEVVTYDGDRRLYFLGKVTSGYEWRPQVIADKPHARRVTWTHQVFRDPLSPGARNTLGAIQTLFRVAHSVAEELRRAQVELGSPPPASHAARPPHRGRSEAEDGQTEEEIGEEILEKADDFIEDRIARLDWEQMQELVAGLLCAMGYKVKVSPRGADRGVDVFASPDGLGLQEPRIVVQVKHRTGKPTSNDEVSAFLNGRKSGEKCLYVSTGGFSKEACYEAERSTVPITLVNLEQLRVLVTDHYERLDSGVRKLVSLRRIYWPVA